MKKQTTKQPTPQPQTSPSSKPSAEDVFSPVYEQFMDRPREAVLHLKRVKEGVCTNAIYREGIGYIDIVWGWNNPLTNKGLGLKHIIEKHSEELAELGFTVEDFIPHVFKIKTLQKTVLKEQNKIVLRNSVFRVVIKTQWEGKKCKFLLTAFDLRKKA